MPGNAFRFGFIVEGHGEVEAVPALVRRICHELFEFYLASTAEPIRVTKSRLVRDGELERAIRLARWTNAEGPVLVVVDADDDCPAVIGPKLKARANAIVSASGVSIVIPNHEFEAWFLASAQSLSGKRGLRDGLLPPTDPAGVRGAKEWLSRNMASGGKYSPTVDQAALVAAMDLREARSCKSFDRLCREIERLISTH